MALVYESKYDFIAKIGDKEIKFKPWTAKEERTYLQALEDDKIEITDKLIFDILIKPAIEDKTLVLSVQEQKLLMIEIRKESISKEFQDEITCKECEEKTIVNVEIDSILSYEKSNYKSVTVENMIFNLDEIKTNKSKERLNLDKGIINYIFTDFLLHIQSIDIDGNLNDKFSFKELQEFMDSLPTKIFDEVFEQYQKMTDSLKMQYIYKCPHCNNEQTVDYTNIPNFLWL